MSLTGEICNEIRVIMQHLTEVNVCQEFRFPASSARGKGITDIHPEGSMSYSAALDNIPYNDAYNFVRKANAYNMILLDGALIQFRYSVRNSKKVIVKHNLSFWPSPRLLPSDQSSWIYEEDEPFGDAVNQLGILPVPIRIDYAPEQFVEHEHPMCHATLGQYPNCRIAVAGPIRPGLFLNFVLHNFYRNELESLSSHFPFRLFETPVSITPSEANTMLHISVPNLVKS